MAARVKPPPYTREILRLAASISHTGELDPRDARIEMRSPTCGSRIRVDLSIDAEKVEKLALWVEACAFGQAATALMAQTAKGTTLDQARAALHAIEEWLAGRRNDPGDWPGMIALEPVIARAGRHGAVLLPFRALVAALEGAKE